MYYVYLEGRKGLGLLKTFKKHGPAVKFAAKLARKQSLTVHIIHPTEGKLSVYFQAVIL